MFKKTRMSLKFATILSTLILSTQALAADIEFKILDVSPKRAEVNIIPGKKQIFHIMVKNQAKENREFQLGIQPLHLDPLLLKATNDKRVVKKHNLDFNDHLLKYIKPERSVYKIKAGELIKTHIVFDAPKDAKGHLYFKLKPLDNGRLLARKKNKQSLGMELQSYSPILVNFSSTEPVNYGLKIDSKTKSDTEINVALKNKGYNYLIDLNMNMTLISKDGKVLLNQKMTKKEGGTRLYHNRTDNYFVKYPMKLKGEHTVIITLFDKQNKFNQTFKEVITIK